MWGARVYVVAHEILVSAKGSLVLAFRFWGFGAKGMGSGLDNTSSCFTIVIPILYRHKHHDNWGIVTIKGWYSAGVVNKVIIDKCVRVTWLWALVVTQICEKESAVSETGGRQLSLAMKPLPLREIIIPHLGPPTWIAARAHDPPTPEHQFAAKEMKALNIWTQSYVCLILMPSGPSNANAFWGYTL